ncbi:potassium channel family protein [Oceanitalea stevensii]|uniref:potassium channel family protein n=1 Tax=Oceanitalea stevensii TaxID=2763072 RepID=UPI002044DB4E|nr:TrkA family potassium uptake protein [Oceanitalea stevensii]
MAEHLRPRRRGITSLGRDDSVVVIGLGRFGQALALELAASGVDVLGIDTDETIVQDLNGRLTQVVRADATREEVLRQLGVADLSHAVVAIGSSMEASILTSSWLLRLAVPHVWAKAITAAHGQILTQLGVHHVVYPESDMGRRVAHLLRGTIAEYLDLGGGFAMVTAAAPEAMTGRPLDKVGFRKKHNLNVVAVRQPDGSWGHATGETVLAKGDTIIVVGPAAVAERFMEMT